MSLGEKILRHLHIGVTARKLYFSTHQWSLEELDRLENEFFGNLRLRNGSFKSTRRRRLDELNTAVEPFLPPARPLEILDVGVSSGITSFEWSRQLEQDGIAHRLVASDGTFRATLISISSGLHVLVDSAGYPIQFEIGGRGIRTSARNRLIDGALSLARLAVRVFLARRPALRARVTYAGDSRCELQVKELNVEGVKIRPLLLVTQREPIGEHVELAEEDLLSPSKPGNRKRFHVIRAANILNPSYFNREAMGKILEKLRGRLRTGGVLIVCRTSEDGANDATVLRLSGDREFSVVCRLGSGSPIDELLTGTAYALR